MNARRRNRSKCCIGQHEDHCDDCCYREVFGPKTKGHQEWFDKNDAAIQEPLDRRNVINVRKLGGDTNAETELRAMKGDIQRKLRNMEDSWCQKSELKKFRNMPTVTTEGLSSSP